MSVVHDIAECVVGDIIPADNVPEKVKHEAEMGAMKDLVKNLPEVIFINDRLGTIIN